MSNNIRKNVSMVMIITMVSKVFGFARDIVLAYFYGTSDVTDAFYIAQTIPEFLFILVVQAISIGFTPIFVEIREKKGFSDANKFANNILKICLVSSVALIVFVNLFTKVIVGVFANGFQGEKAELTIRFTRIIVFSMVFRITVAIYSTYLNANGCFMKPAINGIILDMVFIVSIVISFYTSSLVLAYGIIVGTFLQLVVLFSSVRRLKPHFTRSTDGLMNDDVRRMLKYFLPLLLGIGASQINVLADRTMASSIDGAVSALNYAGKTNSAAEQIIILSLSTVVFPQFSKNVAANDRHLFARNVKKSLNVVSITMIPCAVLFFQYSEIIIRILFERGAFNISSIESTSSAMKCYSVGLLFLSYNAILTRALYAKKAIDKVSIVSCAVVATNVIFNFLLKPIMGIGGLALATSISNMMGSVCFSLMLKDDLKEVFGGIVSEIKKAAVSTACMLVAINILVYFFSSSLLLFVSFLFFGGLLYIAMEMLQKSALRSELYAAMKKIRH